MRIEKKIVTLIFLSMQLSCNFRPFLIRNFDEFLYYEAKEAWELTSSQRNKVDVILDHSWKQFLCQDSPVLEQRLIRISSIFNDFVADHDLRWLKSELKYWRLRLLNISLPSVAKFLLSLRSDQWGVFQAYLDEKNEKLESLLKEKNEDFEKKYFSFILNRYKKIYDDLGEKEETYLSRLINSKKSYFEKYLEQRKKTQENFMQFFKRKPDLRKVSEKLIAWTDNPILLRAKDNQNFYKKYRKAQWYVLINFHNNLSKSIKKSFSNKVKSLASDIKRAKPSSQDCLLLLKKNIIMED